jgi:ABC-2 type transport system ATP-binding protein
MNNAIIAQNLTKYFDGFPAVNGISFNVNKGKIYGLLGENGAGKTTTIRMLCGLIPPTQGSITVAQINVIKEREKVKEKIGYMSQKLSLYEDLKLWENMELYAGIYGVNRIKDRIKEVMDMMELKSLKENYVKELPMGIRQRLALACSILHKPEILFLDEPTAGVDPLSRVDFWKYLTQFIQEGMTVLLTTHLLDEAERAHEIIFMHRGKIIFSGDPQRAKEKFNLKSLEELFVELIKRDEENNYNK